MIHLKHAQLQAAVVHQVGNRHIEEPIRFSEQLIPLDNERLVAIISHYFLSSFSGNEEYRFFNEVGIDQNEMYTIAKRLFANPDDLLVQSNFIARFLYECSAHPRIKGGEVYVAYFKDVEYDNETMDAIGVFKAENKESYLKVNFDNRAAQVMAEEGTNAGKPDKGCLIFNTLQEDGYRVCIVDHLSKGNEAAYWKDDFLGLQPISNEFLQTNQMMGIAKQYVTQKLTEEFEVSKPDQIDLLNRSVEYFKTHESFDQEEFEQEVFADAKVIESFRQFDETYRSEYGIEVADKFDISPQAVKKQARVFKSVLKLDKNFHIYIHGNRELIEQGVEPDGRKFYKIYYQEEQ